MASGSFSAEALLPIAIAAGEAILAIYRTDFAVDVKGDASPVTAADQEAEAIILAGLRELHPDIPIVAEEECAAGRVPATGGRFFLVDPLDGTREFIGRNGEFTVNIALIENGVPVGGVVHAPALGRIFWGDRAGAHEATVSGVAMGETREIRVRAVPEDGIVVVGSRSHGSPETERYIARHKVADFRSAGSSLKFCLVAAGEADLYPRFGRTMEWDTAAGDAVLRAAGGVMCRTDGSAFFYGKRHQPDESDFANPYFIAASSAALVV